MTDRLTLDLGDVDVLADALGEGLEGGAWDHWNDEALTRLDNLRERARKLWNDAPRSAREEFL